MADEENKGAAHHVDDDDDDEQSIFPCVAWSQFHDYCATIQDTAESVIQYETLKQLAGMAEFSEELHPMVDQSERNKNRYIDVVPYSSTRVLLNPLTPGGEPAYINASHIKPSLRGTRQRYIAAQAPLPAVMGDWWRMVWEQDIRIMVMLTKVVEAGRVKADVYWPDLGQNARYGDVTVELVTQEGSQGTTSIVRTFLISKLDNAGEAQVRQIVHLQFTVWPDFSCPAGFDSFLDLFRLYRQLRATLAEKNNSPVLVHCSAGIGRTGVFIAVDELLDYLEDYAEQEGQDADPPINVFNVVQKLREQRMGMIQTADQYAYVFHFLDFCLVKKFTALTYDTS